MNNIDPALLNALKLEEDFWSIGGPAVKVTTHSGVIYHVKSDGSVTGGSRNIGENEKAELNGAVYRGGGPIRINKIVYGLGMEIYRKRDGSVPNVLVTSNVVKIENE